MKPNNNEIERLIQACSTGRIDLVKIAYEKYGNSIINFKKSGTGDSRPENRYLFYYSVRNGHMDIAFFLKKLDPSNPNVSISKVEAYSIMVDILSNKRGVKISKNRKNEYLEKCSTFIENCFSVFDRETIILSSVDYTLKCLDIDLYETLINKFHVNPRNFSLRMDEYKVGFDINSTKYKIFMREIKLRSLLDDR